MPTSPIVVLTPVKNEEWILDRFLAITSHFADAIIVADQHSTDKSCEICHRFPKITLIDNPGSGYDEQSRQQLLIAAARERILGPKILLALDADEVLAADSLSSPSWEQVRCAPAGTTLFFEKPDLLFPPTRYRPSRPFPLGYSDNGRRHGGLFIHSTRVPASATIPHLIVPGIRFLHLAMTRPAEFFARQRLYSALENVARTKSTFQRLAYYSRRVILRRLASAARPTPPEWWQGWRERGIDLFDSPSSDDNHFNREVLRLFFLHGERRFFLDDVWEFDWEALRLRILAGDPGAAVPSHPVVTPGPLYRAALELLLRARLHQASQ